MANNKKSILDDFRKDWVNDSPFGERSLFSEANREKRKQEEEVREKERQERKQQMEDNANKINEIPAKFNRGKDGRILFETIGGVSRITVVMHLCFYGGGFEDLYERCVANNYQNMVKTPQIIAWLDKQHLALVSEVDKIKKAKPQDLSGRLNKIKVSFYNGLVAEQCRYLMSALNEFSHTALGPDGKAYCVYFELDGEYFEEDTAKQYMIDNTIKTIKTGLPTYRPANNALFFVRLEAVDASPRNSSMPGLLDRKSVKKTDNSIFISTLHLSATPFTHEIIVHPYWGRGLNSDLEHLGLDWAKNPVGYDLIPSIRFVDYDPTEVGNNNPEREIKGLPEQLKILGTNRLDKEKRKVLPPDILLSQLNSPIAWDKGSNSAWVGDATNTFFKYDKKYPLALYQEQYDAGQEVREEPKYPNEKPDKIRKILWGLFFLFNTILGFSSCKISDCQKAEEAIYAKYRYSLTHDSIRNDSNKNEIIRSGIWYDMTFDCNHRYTKRYIRKHLGKPMRICIVDYTPDFKFQDTYLLKYEDWLYPASMEYHPNKKPFIGEILILRFELHKPKLRGSGNCPSKFCHEYSIISGADEIHTDAILLLNSDSFDIKYPYILKNEQIFY